MAERPQLSPTLMARMGAALATTLADLHDIGVVHRCLEPGHVLIDGSSRPILCGFGSSRYAAGTEPLEQWRRDDVAALARLLISACTAAPGPRAAAVLHAAASGRTRTGLRRRPVDARNIARTLAGAAGPASAARRDETLRVPAATRGRLRVSRRAGRTRLALMGLVIAGGLAVIAVLRPSAANSSAVPPPPAPSRAALASTAARCPPQDDDCVPLPDGGSATGRVGLGYRIVGASGVVVLGRWDCRSPATPAVLDRSTGRVWVFDSWPGVGGRAVARLVAVAPAGSNLRVVPQMHEGCDRIEITGSGRPARVVSPLGPDAHPDR